MKVKEFKTSRPPSNPLQPVYKLASYEAIPPPETRFLRDQMDISDIEKSRPAPIPQNKFLRETNYTKDIEGAHAKKEYLVQIIILKRFLDLIGAETRNF